MNSLLWNNCLYGNSRVTPPLPLLDSWFTTVLVGSIQSFVNFPPLFFEPTGDHLGVNRKKLIFIQVVGLN